MVPRNRKPPAWYQANPHAKFSFTRLSSWRRCPAWFRHVYLEWHRTWSIPVMRAGHAVQEALERTFDASPGGDIDLETLGARAFSRMKTIFDAAWERERKAHEADPNGLGPWDLPKERYEGYVRQGLVFHLGEVRARLESRRPRTGEPLDLPPVDDVGAAWTAVRPWHAPHDVDISAAMECIPDGWFQGQYDLVYDWTGGRRIVDLKASAGRSLFSTEIELQLRSYAFMERELGRGRPEGIEAWFLGRPEPLVFDVPDDASLDAFAAEVNELIEKSGSERGFGEWSAEDFAPAPEQLEGFAAQPGDASGWCSVCPAAFTCPKTARNAPPPRDAVPFDRAPEKPEVAVSGLVLGVAEPQEKAGGKVTRRFTLANTTGPRSFTWEAAAVSRLVAGGLKAGRVVRISGIRPWIHPSSGDALFYDTPGTRIEVLAPEWDGIGPAPDEPE